MRQQTLFMLLGVCILGLYGCSQTTSTSPTASIAPKEISKEEALAQTQDGSAIQASVVEEAEESPIDENLENDEDIAVEESEEPVSMDGEHKVYTMGNLPEGFIMDDKGYVVDAETGEHLLNSEGQWLGNYMTEDGLWHQDILTEADQEILQGLDDIHQSFQETHPDIDITTTSGRLEAGPTYFMPAGKYKFSIKPEYGFSGIHIYDKDTNKELYSTVLHIDEAAGINDSEEVIDIPENSYVHATYVDFKKVE